MSHLIHQKALIVIEPSFDPKQFKTQVQLKTISSKNKNKLGVAKSYVDVDDGSCVES